MIHLGSDEYARLGAFLRPGPAASDWAVAAALVAPGGPGSPLAPAVDAQFKIGLFATQMLPSPNYSGVPRELLVSQYYVNECAHAIREMAAATDDRDAAWALAALKFGRDSRNLYLSIVNRAISPNVGEVFAMIA